jgi:hypothetical protein
VASRYAGNASAVRRNSANSLVVAAREAWK